MARILLACLLEDLAMEIAGPFVTPVPVILTVEPIASSYDKLPEEWKPLYEIDRF